MNNVSLKSCLHFPLQFRTRQSTKCLQRIYLRSFVIFFLYFLSLSLANRATMLHLQEILQSQKPGRLEANGEVKLSERPVFTKMECLDICLRTSECGSLDMKQTQSEKGTQKPWICVINRRVVFEGTMLDLTDKNTGWIHFPVTSQELQRVSWDAKEIRSPNNSSVFWSLDWQFKSYLIVQLYSMPYIQITRKQVQITIIFAF